MAATARAATPAEPIDVIGSLVEGDAAQAMGRDLERLNTAFVTSAIVSIIDAGSYQAAAHFLKELADRRKRVVDFFSGIKTMAHKLHKGICARENVLLGPLDAIDRQVRTELQRYTREEEATRRAEEQRLQEQARQDEERRLLDEAALLERQGHRELAAGLVEQAMEAPAPVITVASQTPVVAGVTTVDRWSWRCVNDDEARAVQLLPRDYLCVDRSKLNTYARMHKGSAKLPGVEFFNEGAVRVRS